MDFSQGFLLLQVISPYLSLARRLLEKIEVRQRKKKEVQMTNTETLWTALS
jgi:hypothetical protein